MVDARVYVEGGGNDSKHLQVACRRGFNEFLKRAGLAGCMPRIEPCGSRRSAYDDFCRAHANAKPNQFVALLVDSEGPVTDKSAWRHLKNRPEDGWSRPAKATDEQCHLMVQCMESWFLADLDAVASFYGQGFRRNTFPDRPLEEVAKSDLFASLKKAVKGCKAKSTYDKGKHSFELLSRLDPGKVAATSPWADRLVNVLKKKLAGEGSTS